MSVFFGIWNFDRHAPKPELLLAVRRLLDRHAPDGATLFVDAGVAMLYGAIHTSPESRSERQPAVSRSGELLLWNGRLDNRSEFPHLDQDSSDLQLVAESWELKGRVCLAELLGDWALAVFSPEQRTLFLARDFLGSHPLYYVRGDSWVAWSSLLEPLIALSPDRLSLSEEYVAGWLAGFPEAYLTPYAEIRAVPPSSVVTIRPAKTEVKRYWDFRPQPVRYSTDSEYEEAFRFHFSRSIKRRLRADAPVLAELSGGMDSSAIVSVADRIAAEENMAPVETLSFYDDSEPNWNERPFFASVEAHRGRAGFHLDVAGDGRFLPERDGSLPTTPVHGARPSTAQLQLSEFLSSGSFRVVLTGIGGDEFTGGVPTAVPELADLVSRVQLLAFLQRAFEWALSSRKPIAHVMVKTIASFLPRFRRSTLQGQWPMPWLLPTFLRRNRHSFTHLESRYRLGSSLPSFQENLRALEGLRRQISCAELQLVPCEKRYPFLDRDLLGFLFNIPREQLVRPTERRSLLRRALRGIVPKEILERSHKAYPRTSHLKAIGNDWERVSDLATEMQLESRGALDSAIVRGLLDRARRGQDVALLPLMRVLRLEWWLRDPHIVSLFAEPQRGMKARAAIGSPQPAPTGSQPG
jgi:asparagine synthase (glutamine-hydrolysing)